MKLKSVLIAIFLSIAAVAALSETYAVIEPGTNVLLWEDGEYGKDLAVVKTLPMYEERAVVLNELLSKLKTVADIKDEIMHQARNGKVSIGLAAILAEELPHSFQDPYLKKAQLAISAVGGLVTHGEGVAVEDNLTAFADYEVPRVLNHHGVLKYCPGLESDINQGKEICSDSEREKAIRSATILAVEEISRIAKSPASAVDNYLWCEQKNIPSTPAHYTNTTLY